MKAFVTGATGFLGSHLVDLLVHEGDEVACLVRKGSNLRWLKSKPVQLFEGELEPGNFGLQRGLKDADWCFHVAGILSSSDPQRYFKVNVGGTRHCLDACLRAAPKLKRFVLVSSIAAMGPSPNGKPLEETAKENPIDSYGWSKLEGEKIALSYRERLPITIIRPPAIYGPRDELIYPVFKMARRRLFFIPSGKRRFITMAYVEDVAGACLWGAKSEKAAGETYFISDGDLHVWDDVADSLSRIFFKKILRIPLPKSCLWPLAFFEEKRSRFSKKPPRIHRGHVKEFYSPSWSVSIDKIRNAGFTPQFPLDAGMEITVAGYRQLGWL